jgi:3',5'-cyclic AMP phosphodiesterase CpdA
VKLAWATDVHLDHCTAETRREFHDALRATGADAVLLTGDLAEARSLAPLLRELAAAVDRPVHFVLGNHDFYGGTVAGVRAVARRLTDDDPRLVWLGGAGVVLLGETALVGHDGWADGRFGDWAGSRVLLNDYVHIEDLAEARLDRAEILPRIQRLAGESAAYFAGVLPEAMASRRRVLVATHVPPFREACWHEGRISGDEWMPHFSSRVVGEAIAAAAGAHPEVEVTVVCGHTHGEGTAQILPNLLVRTGGAVYGKPALAAVLAI